MPIKVLQLEEDTAKSTYSKEGIKLDFNRAGNPLIELVTEPVFHQEGLTRVIPINKRLIKEWSRMGDNKFQLLFL